MDTIERITKAIEPSLDSMGYGLVQVKLGDGGGRKTLTIMAERKDDAPMGVDDCTRISRQVSALLDVEDPIATAYDLEVSSPGVDRPLTKLADFVRYTGTEAKVETYAPISVIDNRKRFRGILLGVNGEKIRLRLDDGEVEMAFADIRNARLMVSESLLKKKK